ncbi:MAG TPA: CoB--CoM heterodisulfide reductase iron-sulfur subunit A family protein [Anaerolineales bacterium]|nr:CoB--CoM heterodisulfide reductase iron-sulfur subunit A family protein [Anaerolineales bacterium]
MSRIGLFVCHCGINIAATVDVERVAEVVGRDSHVVFATDYKYMCSDPGQQLIKDAIVEHGLDGVIVAACSPGMHEKTFRATAAAVGLNPYRCEIANIREQCSWVHQEEPERATEKAIEIVRTMVEKVRRDEDLVPFELPITRRALVIGGGVAGLEAALSIASAGYPVVLVEREGYLGGKMARLSGTYLNFEAAPDLLQQRVGRVLNHPNIRVLLNAQVTGLEGYVGNFKAEVSGSRVQIPGSNLKPEAPKPETLEVGAVVVATGWDPYPLERLPEYGGGRVPDVIDGLAFEEMLRPGGELRRPSDGRVPREVVFVQCAGSRDPERGVSYCSKVCCMYVAKQAMMFKERVPEGQAYVFYIDIRSAGKGYDEYVQRAMEQHDVLYLRGKVSKIFRRGGRVVVWGADTLAGRPVEVEVDLVVLATAMLPSRGAIPLAQTLHIQTDGYGFYNEAHPKLRPVESLTAGIFLAGAGQGPKDIPEAVAQAGGAAAKVLQLFAQEAMVQEPTVAYVVEELCAACGACVAVCPYEAREIHPVRGIATVNAALCQTCGACVVACPNKASRIHNWEPGQVLAMADVLTEMSS